MPPAIILVTPQMGENIGAAARAMANCGLTEMRLVNPRDGWPNEKADASSSGATHILRGAKLYETTAEAVADLTYVLASTARPRDLVKPVVTPEEGARELHLRQDHGQPTGILFGAERMGLLNEDIALADAIATVPLNPEFTSLNLAQAVLLFGYEWYKAIADAPARQLDWNGSRPAAKAELVNCFEHLEDELERSDYFKNPKMKPTMTANLRAMLQRAELSEQEVRTLHGMIVALTGRSRRKKG
jgi:tRNA/rRNA methyltransferase